MNKDELKKIKESNIQKKSNHKKENNNCSIEVSAATYKNTVYPDKPNEDYYLYDNNLFIILDGVSRDLINKKYPNPSPAKEVSKIIAHSIYNYILKNKFKYDDIHKLIENSIIYANEKVNKYNISNKLDFKAGAVGIIMIIKNDIAYYAFIGDCVGLALDKEINYFTRCQTELIHIHKSEFAKNEIRENICNNINHPYSYGVLNGDLKALDFLEKGTIKIKPNMSIILTSDGLYKHVINEKLNLKNQDALTILNKAIKNNNINQDDRTIIKINIT